MSSEPICPDPALWQIACIASRTDRIVLHLQPMRAAVDCPVCGTPSGRVHSRYYRQAWDLPWAGWPVALLVQARRFFCDVVDCPRRIFTEPFPNALARYARQTERVKAVLLELVHASNGEMAAKVARLLGFITSPDTLIRLQRGESFALPPPRALGVDEFALRRGRTYATLLVDLERHRPIDLFEGLSAAPFTRWLQGHPQVEVLARDRAWAYALAGRVALPQAQQVSDRFHLVYNVGKALKELLHSRRWQIPEYLGQDSVAVGERRATPSKQAGWTAVQRRKGTGASISAIARELDLSRQTVSKYLAADQPPIHGVRPPGPSKVRPYLAYFRRRWIEGCRSSRKLYHEVVQQGYTGTERSIRKAIHPWRSVPGPPPKRSPPLHWLVLRPYQALTGVEQERLDWILSANPVLAQGHRLKEKFQRIVHQHDVAGLDDWLQEAAGSGIRQFQRVARGFRKDYAAIQAALTTPWSTAQCEGQNCRVKLIKRLGHGRAKPDLLRQRVLHRLAG